MNKKLFIIIAGILIVSSSLTFYGNSISSKINKEEIINMEQHIYKEEKINGYNIKYEKTYIGPGSNYDVNIGIAKEGGEFLGDMIQSNKNAISGINGAYFSPKAYGKSKINETWSNRITNGKEFSKTSEMGIRMMFGLDKNNKTILLNTEANGKYNKNDKQKIKEGISNFPGLLKDGKDITLNWNKYIDSKMNSKRDKTFLCTDQKNNIYFGIIKNIKMKNMSSTLKKLGCYNAINLDAGASTSLIYNSEYKVAGWSPVMDGIFIVKKNGLTKEELKKKEKLKSGNFDNTKYNIYNYYQKIKRFFK